MAVPRSHYLDVVDGEFHGTTADDLEELFKEVEKSEHSDHIVVHFHGGLGRIADQKITKLDELMPWSYAQR